MEHKKELSEKVAVDAETQTFLPFNKIDFYIKEGQYSLAILIASHIVEMILTRKLRKKLSDDKVRKLMRFEKWSIGTYKSW